MKRNKGPGDWCKILGDRNMEGKRRREKQDGGERTEKDKVGKKKLQRLDQIEAEEGTSKQEGKSTLSMSLRPRATDRTIAS